MISTRNKVSKESSAQLEKVTEPQRPFSKINFYMMGGCLVLIVLGFILMSGGGSGDTSFNPEIFSARRIVVGPLLAFLGFLFMAFAIVWSPAKRKGK